MSINPSPNKLKHIAALLFSLLSISFLFAQEPALKESLTQLKKQARLYRSEGLELQKRGDFDRAMGLYQKAIELDPAYAIAYNDLGITYEARGFTERAQESYLKAIEIDPVYLSAYTNLALLYENRRDLDKARYHWQKRATLGVADDPWTEKAKQRLKDIDLVLSQRPLEDIREQEAVSLVQDMVEQKTIQRTYNQELAKVKFQKAKLSYEKHDEVTALKEAIDAHLLDPSNQEIEKFIEKVQTRLLSR